MTFVPDFGSVPDWVEAIGTAGAFIGLVITLRQGLDDRREAEASNIDYYVHLVSSDTDDSKHPVVTITNSNRTAINDVILATPLARGPDRVPRNSISVGKIPPGSWDVDFRDIDPNCADHAANLGLLAPFITFLDSHSRVWQRGAEGTLERGRAKDSRLLLH